MRNKHAGTLIGAVVFSLLLGTLLLYRHRSSVPVRTVAARTLSVVGIADSARFSPDGKVLAVVTHPASNLPISTYCVEIWNTATWQRQRTLPNAEYFVFFSPDSKRLFCAGNTVKEWNVSTGQLSQRSQDQFQDRSLKGGYIVAFSPDRRLFALQIPVFTRHKTLTGVQVIVCNAETHKPVTMIRLHREYPSANDAVFSPDNSVLAIDSGDGGKELTLWNVKTGTEITSLGRSTLKISQSAFSPDGKVFAMTGAKQPLTFWNTSTWKEVRACPLNFKTIQYLEFSPTGRKLLVSGSGAPPEEAADEGEAAEAAARTTVSVWDVGTGKAVMQLQDWYEPEWTEQDEVVTEANKTMTVWDTATGSKLVEFGSKDTPLGFPAVSPNNRLLAATGNQTSEVKIWNIPSR